MSKVKSRGNPFTLHGIWKRAIFFFINRGFEFPNRTVTFNNSKMVKITLVIGEELKINIDLYFC
jgi:hypothetical protein